MARIYIRQAIRELNRQRRQIERAIAALNAIEEERPQKRAKAGIALRKRRALVVGGEVQKENGTRGNVVPFVREVG